VNQSMLRQRADAIYHATGWAGKDRQEKCPFCLKTNAEPAIITRLGEVCASCTVQTLAQAERERSWQAGRAEGDLAGATAVLRLKALARGVPVKEYGYWGAEQPGSIAKVIDNLAYEDGSHLERLVRLLAYEVCVANQAAALHRLAKLPSDAPILLKLNALLVVAFGGLQKSKQIEFVVRMSEDSSPEIRERAVRILADNRLNSAEAARELLRVMPLVEGFEATYNREELRVISRIVLGPPSRRDNSPSPARRGPEATAGALTAKQSDARDLALFFSAPGNVRELLTRLDPEAAKVLALLAWHRRAMESAEIRASSGVEVIRREESQRYRYVTPKDVLQDLRLCKVEILHSYDPLCRLELPPFLAEAFRSALPPPRGHDIVAFSEAPPAQYKFENKDRILSDLGILTAFIEQGGVEYGKTGRVRAASLAAAAKACGLPEFYPGAEGVRKHAYVRLLMDFLLKTQWPPEKSRPEVLLRDLMLNFLAVKANSRVRDDSSFFRSYLFHLTGNEGKTKEDDVRLTAESLGELLRSLPEGGWVICQNIIDFVTFRGLVMRPVSSEGDLAASLAGVYSPVRTYASQDYPNLVVEPFLKTMMFLFACLGVVDLRFGDPHNELRRLPQGPYLTDYDGLSMVRLTPLGSFVTGRAAEYQSEAGRREAARVQLDSRRLLLTLSGSDPVLQMILERTAEKVGAGLFRINARTFLKDCRKVEDVERKVKVLRDLLPADLPLVWQEFFTGIVGKVNPLKPTRYKLYQLGTDPGLVRILANDPELGRLILKAENRHIAIGPQDLDDVIKRLREHGYFIDRS